MIKSPAAVCFNSRFAGDCSSFTGELLDTVKNLAFGVPLCLSLIFSLLLGVSPFTVEGKGFTAMVVGGRLSLLLVKKLDLG